MRVLTVFDDTDARVLRLTSRSIADPLDADVQGLAARLLATARHERGNGLAAPQVGISRRLIVVQRLDLPASAGGHPYEVCINPEVLRAATRTAAHIEACLSMPGYSGPVGRPAEVNVQYTDSCGRVVRHTFSGRMALVFCHEVDHLDGVLFTDRLKDRSLLKPCLPWEH